MLPYPPCTKLRGGIVFVSCLLVISLASKLRTGFFELETHKDSATADTKFDEYPKNQSTSKLQIREKHYLDYLDLLKEYDQEKSKRLPDAIIIGVAKCGTGFLRDIMRQHPQLKFPPQPEPQFFSILWHYGLEFYKRLLPMSTMHETVMEKSPSYFRFRFTPKRMKSVLPNIKLIAILCDPVNRTISDYVQNTLLGHIPENSTFDSYIPKMISATSRIKAYQDDDERVIRVLHMFFTKRDSHILSAALYYYHLKRWFQSYDRSQFFIIDGADLITDPGKVAEELQDFLNVSKLIVSEDFEKNDRGFYCLRPPRVVDEMGKRGIVPDQLSCAKFSKGRTRLGRWEYQPSADTINNLKDFFRPFNEKLYQLLGRRFKWQ